MSPSLHQLRRVVDVLVASLVLVATTPVVALAVLAALAAGATLRPLRQRGVGGGTLTRWAAVGGAPWWSRFGLDRWPSWWHVLRGELSLVGPRFVSRGEIGPRHVGVPAWLWALPGTRPGLVGPAQRCTDEGVAPFASLRDRVIFDLGRLDHGRRGRLDGLLADATEVARWAFGGSRCAVGNDYVHLEVPSPWRHAQMSAGAWLSDGPATLGPEVDRSDDGRLRGWWYPPRALALSPASATGAQWRLLDELADDLEAVGERGLLVRRRWQGTVEGPIDGPPDVLRVDLSVGLHAIDRLCARLDDVWAGFERSAAPHVALLAACAHVASTAPRGRSERVVVELRWTARELVMLVVPGSASGVRQHPSGERERAVAWSRLWDGATQGVASRG